MSGVTSSSPQHLGFRVYDTPGLVLTNLVFWGSGGGDDFSGSNFVTVTYTCSQEFLGLGAGNQILFASSYDLGANSELF